MKIIPQTSELAATLRKLERTGKYSEAVGHLSGFWTDIDSVPDLRGFGKREAGEILLRCGTLAGFLGGMSNSGAQENSKNLFTKARQIFQELGDEERIVEAENGLALSYLRKGEHHEAEVWIGASLEHDVPATNYVRLESFICKSLVLLYLNQYEEAHDFLQSVASLFEDFDDDYLNGCFATNFGIVEKNLGNFAASMQMYSLARYYHKKSGHEVYLATIENNMAYLYEKEGRYDLAYKCIQRARRLHKKVEDIPRLGFSYDTEAEILMGEGRLNEALEAIDTGLDLLRNTEFTEFLIESLVTKMKILATKGDIASAAITFHKAAGFAIQCQGEKRVAVLAGEFEQLVKHTGHSELGRIFSERIILGENLELELPPALAIHSNFDAVWIKNNDLEKAGLFKGALALVVDTEIERGDIAALVEDGCDDVICGYFDQEFGIVAITNDGDTDPQIFTRETVEILGKIVGFADPEMRHEGKLKVNLLR